MTTNFPGTSIDSFPTHNIGDVIQPSYDNNEQDAIVALETKVGVDGSATSSTFDYKLSGVIGTDKATSKTGIETLTNKTLSTGSKVLVGSDATGDIYYNGGSGVLTRLGVGSSGQVVTVAGGVPTYATPAAVVNASTTVNGTVQAATSGQVTSGTATGSTGAVLAVTPDALALSTPVFNGSALTNLPISHTNGTTTKNIADASTTQTISHGLGRTPRFVRLICRVFVGTNITIESVAVYNGTTQSSLSMWANVGSWTLDNSFTLSGASTGTGAGQTGVITFDGTNISIVWTKVNSLTNTYQILWEAM